MSRLLRPFASMAHLQSRLRGRRIIALNHHNRTMVLDTGMVIEQRTFAHEEDDTHGWIDGIAKLLPDDGLPHPAGSENGTIVDFHFGRSHTYSYNIATVHANFHFAGQYHWRPLLEFRTDALWSVVKEPAPLQVAQQFCFASANTMKRFAQEGALDD